MLLDNQRIGALFVIVFSSLLCLSDCCAQSGQATPLKGSPTDVLAEIADTKIVRADYEKEVENFEKIAGSDEASMIATPEGREDFLKQLVDVTMFEKKAKLEGIENTESYKKEFHNALLNSFAMNRVRKIVEAVSVSDDEAKEFYNKNIKFFTEPDQYHLFWISTDTKEKADAIVKDINSGKSFVEIAKTSSIDSSKDNGGDRGFVRLEDETPEMAAVIEKLEKDKISEPINVADGLYVICKYTEKKTGIVKDFDVVASQIRRELANEKQVQNYKDEIERLKKAYNFSFDEKILDSLRKQKNDVKPESIIAKYDGGSIAVGELYKSLEHVPDIIRPRILSGEGLDDFLSQYIGRILAVVDAEKNFDAYSKEFPEIIRDITRRVLVKHLFDKLLTPVTVSEEEISDFYNKNLSFYKSGKSFHAHHILVEDEATAKTILENLKKDPSKFEEVAKTSSKCPSGKRGGDLGEFSEGQMVPEFDEACKTAALNEVVGPVKTQFGYHIIRVDSRKDGDNLKLEEVREDVINRVLPGKQKAVFDGYLDSLYKEFNVKTYTENL